MCSGTHIRLYDWDHFLYAIKIFSKSFFNNNYTNIITYLNITNSLRVFANSYNLALSSGTLSAHLHVQVATSILSGLIIVIKIRPLLL